MGLIRVWCHLCLCVAAVVCRENPFVNGGSCDRSEGAVCREGACPPPSPTETCYQTIGVTARGGLPPQGRQLLGRRTASEKINFALGGSGQTGANPRQGSCRLGRRRCATALSPASRVPVARCCDGTMPAVGMCALDCLPSFHVLSNELTTTPTFVSCELLSPLSTLFSGRELGLPAE